MIFQLYLHTACNKNKTKYLTPFEDLFWSLVQSYWMDWSWVILLKFGFQYFWNPVSCLGCLFPPLPARKLTVWVWNICHKKKKTTLLCSYQRGTFNILLSHTKNTHPQQKHTHLDLTRPDWHTNVQPRS